MRSNRLHGWQGLAAALGVAAMLAAGCGDDDSDDAAEDTATTSEDAVDTSAPEAAGDGEVNQEFCAALSADLDAIDQIVNSFESSGTASEALVQNAQDANDALRDATPDGLTDEASAIYEPLGDLLDDLESGDSGNAAEDYAAVVGSPSFTQPLGSLTQKCAALVTGG